MGDFKFKGGRYIGGFDNLNRKGSGIETLDDGSYCMGIWENNKIIIGTCYDKDKKYIGKYVGGDFYKNKTDYDLK